MSAFSLKNLFARKPSEDEVEPSVTQELSLAMPDASTATIEAGSLVVSDAGSNIGDIVSQARSVADFIAEISKATREQSEEISQVGKSVADMDYLTQQNAQLVEEMAASADALKAQSDELVQAVGVFQLADGTEVVAELGQTTSRAPLALGQG